MNWQLFSVIFMIVSFVVIVGVDVFLLTRKQQATFSEILRNTARKWQPIIMIICFGFGMLAGHWWW
jgi:hypothetical protein